MPTKLPAKRSTKSKCMLDFRGGCERRQSAPLKNTMVALAGERDRKWNGNEALVVYSVSSRSCTLQTVKREATASWFVTAGIMLLHGNSQSSVSSPGGPVKGTASPATLGTLHLRVSIRLQQVQRLPQYVHHASVWSLERRNRHGSAGQ